MLAVIFRKHAIQARESTPEQETDRYMTPDEESDLAIEYDLPYQKEVRAFYWLRCVQILVALIIFMNFVTSAFEAQVLPEENSNTSEWFLYFEYFYNYIFLIELLVNMYAHYLWEFWASTWNWFDFIIVIVSLMALYFPRLPAISVLRLFRAFRVVRLFKRVKEMRKIIEGVMSSLPALTYAFMVMALILGIWAIMGVDFLGDVILVTAAGSEIDSGNYFFGNFLKSFLSLGQITTFDSWSSGIARDMIYEKGIGAAIYFLTFVFVSGIIMMNVLVALLLDNYLTPSPEPSAVAEKEKKKAKKKKKYKDLLDPFNEFVPLLRKNKVDLRSLERYLNDRAIPEYVANFQDRETIPKDTNFRSDSQGRKGWKLHETNPQPDKRADLAIFENRLLVLEQLNEQLSLMLESGYNSSAPSDSEYQVPSEGDRERDLDDSVIVTIKRHASQSVLLSMARGDPTPRDANEDKVQIERIKADGSVS